MSTPQWTVDRRNERMDVSLLVRADIFRRSRLVYISYHANMVAAEFLDEFSKVSRESKSQNAQKTLHLRTCTVHDINSRRSPYVISCIFVGVGWYIYLGRNPHQIGGTSPNPIKLRRVYAPERLQAPVVFN